MKNIDEKGRNPWSQPLLCTNSQDCSIALPPVPAGMRLVIENMTLAVSTNDSAIDVRLRTGNDNGIPVIFSAPFRHTEVAGANDFYLNANFTEFADETGQAPTVQVSAGNGTPARTIYVVSGRITGYLVNLNN